ncbi:MAG: MBL fold metallo-hydrolase [Sedimentisphaerales bacterium]|nr:MBL fold metallo-hydrolase [Sedimentisphaerales bacterium]
MFQKALKLTIIFLIIIGFAGCNSNQEPVRDEGDEEVQPQSKLGFDVDTIKTGTGDLQITFIGHGTLMLEWAGKVIQVDPWTKFADYNQLPKGDLVLVTHEHRDHLDPQAIEQTRKDDTAIVYTQACVEKMPGGIVMQNGQTKTVKGIQIEAVPAYNIVHMRPSGPPYHAQGVGNGYVITLGDKRVYVAGDTENTPEMKALKNIDIAFLPMNTPYTMTPEMVADAARTFRPKILYPYHYGDTDTSIIVTLLQNEKDLDVRIRNLK